MKENRFEGLSDDQWQVLEIFLPGEAEKRGKGKPHTPWREVCNSLLWILINGARWCDLPKGDQWASRSATHRWLGIWQANGTLEKMLTAVREQAELEGLLNFERLAADGFFFSRKRRRSAD
ncbi:putative transposase (plasmid) [Candidatus Protochlamydia naegleriophila]|uniref:Putative transposase n=1 Tax=Candidatus Protochlamydia naegleriophila TaxID=389348 RepID=A0A0U5JH78_9BACT|nr:transposase [Candidatus Protochlamydia naegleriophila]CUI18164.1 putative transposase [Candidatus Protochlamydia naegleriophila]